MSRMAEYVIGLKGYVIVEADSDEEAIDEALLETPDEMEAEILEIHYELEYPTASGDFDEYASHDVPNVLRNMKAADVQPLKHGKWEYIRNVKLSGTIKLCECNQCHNKIFGGLNYCGNCGAKMDGDAE